MVSNLKVILYFIPTLIVFVEILRIDVFKCVVDACNSTLGDGGRRILNLMPACVIKRFRITK
jgi:hypothetical protein